MAAEPSLPVEAAIERCWSTIGVHGDGSCTLLRRHIHCRNCAVFSAAAAQLLDRELPAGHLDEWSRLVAGVKPTLQPDSRSAVVFRVGSEWLALPAGVFEEILAQRPVHSLPHRRGGAVLGVVNVRGELLVCLSLARLLGIETAGANGRLLVLAADGSRVVCPVDEVQGIERFDAGQLQEAPAALSRAAGFTKALLRRPEQAVGLLDPQALFQSFNRSLALATAT